MKKQFFLLMACCIGSIHFVKAQAYKTAAGAQFDFGSGIKWFGVGARHFFTEHDAVEAEVVFGDPSKVIQVFYQYHLPIPSAENLNAYFGAGPTLQFYTGGSDFYIRPMAGLDYKLTDIPLAISFDWRPFIYLGKTYGGSRFTAGGFGIGAKYVLPK